MSHICHSKISLNWTIGSLYLVKRLVERAKWNICYSSRSRVACFDVFDLSIKNSQIIAGNAISKFHTFNIMRLLIFFGMSNIPHHVYTLYIASFPTSNSTFWLASSLRERSDNFRKFQSLLCSVGCGTVAAVLLGS